MDAGGNALARANLINANEYGVCVAGEGGGNFEDNDMRGNRGEALSGNLGGVRQARNLFDPPQARR